jgi:hypothetical protein
MKTLFLVSLLAFQVTDRPQDEPRPAGPQDSVAAPRPLPPAPPGAPVTPPPVPVAPTSPAVATPQAAVVPMAAPAVEAGPAPCGSSCQRAPYSQPAYFGGHHRRRWQSPCQAQAVYYQAPCYAAQFQVQHQRCCRFVGLFKRRGCYQ